MTAEALAIPRPGFRVGLSSVRHGFGFLLHRPRLWPFAAVPPFLLFSLSAIFLWLAIAWIRPWLVGMLPPTGEWYWSALRHTLSVVGTVVVGLLGILLAMALTPPLSGPALEKIVREQEVELRVPPRRELSLLMEVWCGIRAQAFAFMLATPIILILWVLELLVPPASILTIPLKLIVTGLVIAWNLFDYPLTLRGVRMRDRFRLVTTYTRSVLGFGLVLAALFWVPCFGVLLLPAGVAGATHLVWTLLRHDPSLLPELPLASSSEEATVPTGAR